MTVVDAGYLFTYVDVGSYGKCSDGSVFVNSEFGKLINNETPGFR